MKTNNHINYIEFTAQDLNVVKKFYGDTFGWTFVDYGPTYIGFEGAGIDGGFEQTDTQPSAEGALVILYHDDLEGIREAVLANGGMLTQDIFAFPGGRRFHFTDPSCNHLAIWSDK